VARHAGAAPNAADLAREREARLEVEKFLGPKKAPKKKSAPRGMSDKAFAKVIDEATEFLAKGTWEKAEPKHFVAIYADLHFKVYGAPPGELGSRERAYAATMAKKMLDSEFGGDRIAMSKFVAWTWTREKETEQWRRRTGNPGRRIDWRLQFGGRLLTDFRVDENRRKRGT
jgi:hypothetical protein